MIDQAEKHLNPRRLLLVVEGLDKVDLEAARHIFRDHAPTITGLNAAMIYTFPLALRYSEDHHNIQRYFDQHVLLPNLSLRDRNGEEDRWGRQAMEQIVLNRLNHELITPEALEQLIIACGGIVVELVKLIRQAALFALVRGDQTLFMRRDEVEAAWHWIDPNVSFPKAAAALQPGGWLAVFGHVPLPPPPEALKVLEPIYAEIAPDLWRPPPQAWYLPEGPVRTLFDASGLFGPVTCKAYAWSERVTAAGFVRQLRTRSDYNVIPQDRRERLLAEIEKALARFGELSLRNETHLYLAELKS